MPRRKNSEDDDVWRIVKRPQVDTPQAEFTRQVGQALKRAAKQARRAAKMHGTKLYFEVNGKIVAEKP